MNIMIVGCGKVGQTLAEQLNEDGNSITVIDSRADVVRDVAARLDVMGFVGNGATHTLQQEAGIDKTDLLIAVTGSDELNLLCCLIAKKAGNCQTIARVKNPAYSSETGYLKDELGLAMVINPEHAAAAEIARVLRFPSAIKIDTFAKGQVEILKLNVAADSPLDGIALMEMGKFKSKVLICAVERGEREVYIPSGEFRLQAGDRISIVAAPRDAQSFFRQVGVVKTRVRQVMLIGGGRICYYLAKQLLQSGDYTIKEVAELCGFENFSYFSKVFKEHTGQLPSAVLKKI